MKMIVHSTRSLACALVLASLPLSMASARGNGGVLGRAAVGSKEYCFSERFGGIRNTCSTSEIWVLPFVYDTHGPKRVWIYAKGVKDSVSRVSCEIWSARYDDERWSGVQRTVRSDGAWEELSWSIDVHDRAAFYAYCTMDPGTQIQSVHFDRP